MKILFLVLLTVLVASVNTKLNFKNLYKKSSRAVSTHDIPNARIIGGQEAEPNSIPYQVFLEVYGETKGWYCGGSLISENYVVTAGHCGDGGITAYITLGAHKPLQKEDTQITLTSTEIVVHEEYDEEKIINDISLIKLPEPVSLTDAIQLIKLPNRLDASKDYAGVPTRASGWGLTATFDTKLSTVLNYVDSEVITHAECEDDFGILEDSIICTSGANETGICNGDSGGPLTTDGTLIGVASFGIIFCLPGFASAFTKVTSFLDWIEANSEVQIN